MNLFISGWAGFKEALGDIPKDWYFITPFIELNEIEILNFLENKSGNTVIGWSTGGHIILKNLSFFSQRFKELIVIAGFIRFTHYVSPRIIRIMIEKMKTEPEKVIKEFLINAGCNPLIVERIDYKKLIHGLEFLLSSEVSDLHSETKNLILLQGLYDKILPIKALEELKKCYPFAKTFLIEGHHWIGFEEILKLKASGIA
ncbi:MAG: hypothetical protein NZ826_00480 [Thermodesulfovibrio sp.]|nr:hypothetical protein [Thermodesulfovibrio sp.]